jgi:ribonuclease HIII
MKETVYEARPVDHALRAVRRPGLNIVLYKSGKLVAQGKGVTEWIEFVWEPLIAGEVESSATASPAPVASPLPRIGIDESGKGDFFGPMVIAGFVLTEREVDLLDTLGVRDSKQIKSADKIQRIATALLQHAPSQCEVICLQPETYNRMVGRMGSVNRVLAWGHATVLENLLERFPQISHAVADQFGPEHQIRSALKTRGAAITLEQRHRAESDPAVAAASILARQRFVEEMDSLSQQTAAILPRGATHVRKSAEDLVQRIGPEILTRTAKIHFRTTRQVLEACGYEPGLLGTPEPKPFKRSN